MVGGDDDTTFPNLLVVAREYRRGRVVAFGHGGILVATHVRDNGLFTRNVFAWLDAAGGKRIGYSTGHGEWLETGGPDGWAAELARYGYAVVRVPDQLDAAALANIDVLLVGDAWGEIQTAEAKAVRKWVAAGHGLLMSGLGWSWDAYHPGEFERFPMHVLARPYGVRWARDIGGQPLETLARNGFYTFNIDLYVDMDRVAGSGRTDTLPGRVVEVRREDAWENAVILTPRPEVARAWYALHLGKVREAELRAEKGKVERDDVPIIEAEVEQAIRRDFYFADLIRVRGRQIEFFVPDEVLGGPAREEWAYTVLVTGSDVEQAGRLLNFSPGGFTLMPMSLAPGHATDRFGIVNRGDINQPPIVDLLAPDVETQKRALSDYDVVAPRYAAVPGVSPSGRPAVAASSTAAGPAREPSAGAPPATGAPSEPVAGATVSERPSARRTIPSRLKTLNTLQEEGLISEEEYRQLRRKILAEI